ncbi:zonular occludens toxin domain-containing protein [Chitinivorax sp. B]|uniref:zonular occludens toxin domain-containing protein n=1 Tax=Chitinivorax sp. B TaxID=2502235 RepID=UPI0010F5F97B|nr:zonular occludens toxin domain-containing protein [Chitinivorax sp. B]
MAVYIVTGKLGGGKSLSCVRQIKEYLGRGAPVATNLDIFMDKMARPQSRAYVTRLPDHPTAVDLEALGNGNPSYDESKNGLIVLDECAMWLNTRDWQDKTRQDLINWCLHSRKLGWDMMLIVQDLGLIDKQVRTALCEYTVICRRLDRLKMPLIGNLAKLFGFKLNMPRIHVATVKYGTSHDSPVADRWVFRGSDVYHAYDTKQVFNPSTGPGLHCTLPAWHLVGRYQKQYHWKELLTMAVLSPLWLTIKVCEVITSHRYRVVRGRLITTVQAAA